MPLGDIVIVDVDENTHESSFDDVGELPEEVVSHLKHILKKQSSASGEAVAKAFLNAFAAMIGEYKSAFSIVLSEGGVDVSGVSDNCTEYSPLYSRECVPQYCSSSLVAG